jgi:adenine-specific DNA-methyltransferase
LAKQLFASKQGGFYEVQPTALETFPIPNIKGDQVGHLEVAVQAIIAGAARPRLESLLNAFVYELFFPQELAARGLSPFAAAREAGLDELAGLTGEAATKLYATLFDLQSIDAIRIIEGRG